MNETKILAAIWQQRLCLFDQKYSKISNIVKYYYKFN